jgi:hypothetical protein
MTNVWVSAGGARNFADLHLLEGQVGEFGGVSAATVSFTPGEVEPW